MFNVITTNIEKVSTTPKWEAKTHEISVAILKKDELNPNPVFYASRQGQVYDPTQNFKSNIKGNHAIPPLLIEEYTLLLPEARRIHAQNIAEKQAEKGNDKELETRLNELTTLISDKDTRIKAQSAQIQDQAEQIKDLSNRIPENKPNDPNTDILAKMISELHAVQSNRIEIKIGDKATKIIEKVVHERFARVLELVSDNEAVYCYGPAGTGKSQLAEDVADASDLEFFPASTLTQEFKLSGFIDAGGKFHETNFYRAWTRGGLFFLDEMDSCISDVLVGINGALANGYYDFPIGTIKKHPNFRVIGAGNTIGRGGDLKYTGRQALDLSTLDRFMGIEIDYSPNIDNVVAQGDQDLVEFARVFRETATEMDIHVLLSYRSLGRIAKYKDRYDLTEVLEMSVIKGVKKEDIKMLARNMRIESTNKYFKALKRVG
jgi:cobaltochelatase CobS